MRTVRVFVSVVALTLGGAAYCGAALAERNGPWVYPGSSSSPSREHAVDRGGPFFFDGLFGPSRRDFDSDSYDGGYNRPRRTGEPADIEPVQPAEKIVVYQPDKLMPLSTTAFTESAPSEPLAAAIYTELLNPDTLIKVSAPEKAALLAFYRGNGFKPLWTTLQGPAERAQDVLAFLASSADDGMDPNDYLPPVLASFSDLSGASADAQHLARLDLGLSAAVLRYARQASGGRLAPERLTSYDDIAPEPVNLNGAMKVLAWTPFPATYLESLQPRHPAYALLKAALKEKRKQLGDSVENSENSDIAPGNRVKPGKRDARIPLLRKRLERLGFLDEAAAATNGGPVFGSAATTTETTDTDIAADTLDPELVKALKSFQKSVDIKITGSLDSATVIALNNRNEKRELERLIYNMERLRWLPKDLGTRYVLVNQAAFELRVMDHGKEAWRSRVIIGKPDTQTFAFDDEIEMVVFNPSWGVPQSIIKKEMLPLLRKDPSYLDRLGYRVINRNGKIVRSSEINWWSVGGKVIPFSVQQPPSDDNALGEIKFLFPNKHDIYMHDTPTKPLFEKAMRAYSHGCVRVQNPRRFGEILLGWSADEIAAKIDSGVSETVKLPHKVPVHLAYFTAWPEADGKIVYYDDVYGRDERMERAFGATEVASR